IMARVPPAATLDGWQDPAGAAAETDPYSAFGSTTRPQCQLIAVLEEVARLAAGQLDRPLPTLADLEQRTKTAVFGRRKSTRADQVTGLQVAAVGGMVRDDLRCRPIHRCRRLTLAQYLRFSAFLAHLRGLQRRRQLNAKPAKLLIGLVEQIGQRCGIA